MPTPSLTPAGAMEPADVAGTARREDPPARRAMNPHLGVALGAIAISFAPTLVEGMDPADVGPTGIALYRTLIGGVLLVALALLRRERLRPSRGALGFAALAGALFAGDLWVWHRSIRLVGGGLATILGNTQVFWLSVAGVVVFHERPGRRLFVAIPAALAGIALATGVIGGADARADAVGVALGLLTGVFYASYVLAVRRAQRIDDRLGPVAHMAWTSLACAATSALLALADGERVLPVRPATWGLLAALGAVGQGAGWVTLSTFVPRVPASRAALLLLLQPAFAVAWAALLYGRTMTASQVAGCVLTLAAIYLGAVASAASRPVGARYAPRPDAEPD